MSRLLKIQPLLDFFLQKFQIVYKPKQQLSICICIYFKFQQIHVQVTEQVTKPQDIESVNVKCSNFKEQVKLKK
jgi:hypothetical protein